MAVLMAMTMILSMSMTAFAADAADAPKGTLTVNNTVEGKTLDLYQIFTATKSGENVAYTLNSAYEGFFKNNTRIPGSESLTGEALSEAAYNYVKDQVGPDGSNGAAFAKEILVQTDKNGISEDAVSVVVSNAVVYMPLEDLIDKDKEIERLTKETERLTKEIARCEGMLNNPNFVNKAPAAKVDAEKDKLAKYKEMMDKVKGQLEQLKK